VYNYIQIARIIPSTLCYVPPSVELFKTRTHDPPVFKPGPMTPSFQTRLTLLTLCVAIIQLPVCVHQYLCFHHHDRLFLVYFWQEGVQKFLLCLCMLCVPWLLFSKPAYLHYEQKRRHLVGLTVTSGSWLFVDLKVVPKCHPYLNFRTRFEIPKNINK